MVRFLSSAIPWPYPLDGVDVFIREQVELIKDKNKWAWGIRLKSNPNELIGGIDLRRHGQPGHRGFWLGSSFGGNGIMTEATQRITKYAFEVLGFEELIFSNAVGNLASRRIKEKSAAKFMGINKAKFVDPNLTEQETWLLTKEEWRLHQNTTG